MTRRSAAALAADLSIEEHRDAWARARAPRAHSLLDRAGLALEVVLDEEKRRSLENIRIALGCAHRGVEVDDDFADEVEETLARALA